MIYFPCNGVGVIKGKQFSRLNLILPVLPGKYVEDKVTVELYKMSSYLGVVVLCLLILEARLEATFQLTRGLKDKFTNPQCVKSTGCSASQCAQYFARCETESCAVCVCDEQSPTYVANEKRCVKDDNIFPQTGK